MNHRITMDKKERNVLLRAKISILSVIEGLMDLYTDERKSDIVAAFCYQYNRLVDNFDIEAYGCSLGLQQEKILNIQTTSKDKKPIKQEERKERMRLSAKFLHDVDYLLSLNLEFYERWPNSNAIITPMNLLSTILADKDSIQIPRAIDLCSIFPTLFPTLSIILTNIMMRDDISEKRRESIQRSLVTICRRFDNPKTHEIKVSIIEVIAMKDQYSERTDLYNRLSSIMIEQIPVEYANKMVDFGNYHQAIKIVCRLIDKNRKLANDHSSGMHSLSLNGKKLTGIYIDPTQMSKVDSYDSTDVQKTAPRDRHHSQERQY